VFEGAFHAFGEFVPPILGIPCGQVSAWVNTSAGEFIQLFGFFRQLWCWGEIQHPRFARGYVRKRLDGTDKKRILFGQYTHQSNKNFIVKT
jgi:hypothetical protein